MPIIPYTLQWSAYKIKNGKKHWYYEYRHIPVDVNDAVAAFLGEDDKSEKRYKERIKKQKQKAGIRTVFSLNELVKTEDGFNEDYFVEEITADTTHPENRDPLEIVTEQETERERKKQDKEFEAELNQLAASLMTKKQLEAYKLYRDGYNYTEIAGMLKVDESSVRERLRNAVKRIHQYNQKVFSASE